MSEQNLSSEAVESGDTGHGRLPPVNEQLRAAREAHGIPLHELANTLKLGVRQVEALESGDWHALPGHTFIRGFVRNYARLVELDPLPLMAQLDGSLVKPVNRLDVVESGAAVLPPSGARISRRDRNVMLSGLAAVILASIVYIALPNDLSDLHGSLQGVIDSVSRKEPPAAAPTSAEPEPVFPPGTTPQQVLNPPPDPPMAPPAPLEAPPAAVLPAAPGAAATPAAAVVPAAQPVAGTAPLRFVFEKESWVEVRDRDSKVIFSQKAQPGSDLPVSGNGPFSLVIGYAPGVKLFWRGQPVDLVPHTRADVARLVLE